MLINFLYILTSLILGSTLSKIVTKFLVGTKGLNIFFRTNEVSFLDQNTIILKNYDVIQVILFLIFSVLIFFLLTSIYYLLKSNIQQKVFIGINLLIISFLSYVFVTFVGYSSVQTIFVLISWFIFSIMFSLKVPKALPKWDLGKFSFANGIFTGFYLLLLTRHYISFFALPISLFIIIPSYFYLFSEDVKLLKNPAFILFSLSAFFSFNKIFLMALPFIVLVLLFLIKPKDKILNLVYKFYPFIVIFIFLYNPLFYFGNFDTVEDGFWASWLQRLVSGQVIYKDFAAHHPPGLIWGLYYFTKVFSLSLYNMRLYFHILQIAGYFILYGLVNRIINNRWIKLGTYLLILVFISSFVRNNVEIRFSSSILPILLFYFFKKTNKYIYIVLSGVFSAISLLISTETGLASLIASMFIIMFSSSKQNLIKNYAKYLFGLFAVLTVSVMPLILNGSISKLVEYISFYAGNFSKGYQNIPLDRPEISTLLDWYKIRNYIFSGGFKWEFSIFVILGALILYVTKIFQKKFQSRDVLIFGISIVGIVLARSALARSDYYHISYVWAICLILLGVFSENILKYSKSIPIIIFCFLLFFLGSTQNDFIYSQLFKLQSYANLSGNYPKYETARSGLTANIDINTRTTDELIEYITNNVREDEKIFVFVQEAEIYFLSDRNNATSFDNPTVFFSAKYQEQMIDELIDNKPKVIVYDPSFAIAGISVETLSKVDSFINENYVKDKTFGKNTILIPKNI